MDTAIFVGGDVTKNCLGFTWKPKGKLHRVENSAKGIRQLIKTLRMCSVHIIVIESTENINKTCSTPYKRKKFL